MKTLLAFLLMLSAAASAQDRSDPLYPDNPIPPWQRLDEPSAQRALEYQQDQLDARIDQIQRERAYEDTTGQIDRYYDELDQRRLDAGMREDGQ